MKKSFFKTKVLQLSSFFLLLFFCLNSYAQQKERKSFSNTFIDACIKEVLQDKSDRFIFNANQERYNTIKEFFNNVAITYMPEGTNFKGYVKLSSVALNNRYNAGLKRENNFSPKTFNPLKYIFKKSTGKENVYHVDNTNYIITVQPL